MRVCFEENGKGTGVEKRRKKNNFAEMKEGRRMKLKMSLFWSFINNNNNNNNNNLTYVCLFL